VNYRVSILQRAMKELSRLPPGDYERTRDAIGALAEDPRPKGCAKLTGRHGWRIRVGNYRVIYEIDDAARQVVVVHVGHRRDVYR
jgi:mRNA interferase RelE/StbE